MAKLQESALTVKLSKLLKDSDEPAASIASDEIVEQLEVILQELAGAGVLVEIYRD